MVLVARKTDYDETRRSSAGVEKGAREDFCLPFQIERRFACFFFITIMTHEKEEEQEGDDETSSGEKMDGKEGWGWR